MLQDLPLCSALNRIDDRKGIYEPGLTTELSFSCVALLYFLFFTELLLERVIIAANQKSITNILI